MEEKGDMTMQYTVNYYDFSRKKDVVRKWEGTDLEEMNLLLRIIYTNKPMQFESIEISPVNA